MKKHLTKLTAVLLGIILFSGTYAQTDTSFYLSSSRGTSSPFDFEESKNPTLDTLLRAPADDVLSDWKKLPFPIIFYGEAYDGYKASDNGYITFLRTATKSEGTRVQSLPSTLAPNGAIYGFWTNWILVKNDDRPKYSDVVRSWTYTDPSGMKVHVIQWRDVTPSSMTTIHNDIRFSFAIRIYEDSHFDIVLSEAFNSANSFPLGTMGVEDSAGANAFQFYNVVANNKLDALFYPLQGIPGDDLVYGIFPAGEYDFSSLEGDMPDYAKVNTAADVKGYFRYRGKKTATSFDLNYSVNGGAVQTQNYTGQNINYNDTVYLTHNIPWTPVSTNQLYKVRMWISNINGNFDVNTFNDTIVSEVFVNDGLRADYLTLIEEFTTTACLLCPQGKLNIEAFEKSNYKFAHLAYHYLNTDPMYDPTYSNEIGSIRTRLGFAGNTTSKTDFIFAAFDRKKPALTTRLVRPGIAPNEWNDFMTNPQRTSKPVPVKITMKQRSDGFGLIDIAPTIEFIDHVKKGNYEITIVLSEDNVDSTAAAYSQRNAFSSTFQGGLGGPSHPFYNFADPIKEYHHRNVVRQIRNDPFLITSQKPAKGTKYFQDFGLYSFGADYSYKWDSLYVTIFVHYNDPFDPSERYVLNTYRERISMPKKVGLEEKVVQGVNSFNIYPNPVRDLGKVEIDLVEPAQVSITLLNPLGQEVQSIANRNLSSGKQIIDFSTTDLKSGLYFVKVNVGQNSMTKRVIVQ